jgi:hypothetical protein
MKNIFSFFSSVGRSNLEKKSDDHNSPILDRVDYIFDRNNSGDSYLLNAWVNIAVGILTRNIARASFTLLRDGNEITSGPLYGLFRRPNEALSRFDLWKETAAWWFLEGEAFWWFGPDYAGGLPKELYILDPRRMRHEETGTLDRGPPVTSSHPRTSIKEARAILRVRIPTAIFTQALRR